MVRSPNPLFGDCQPDPLSECGLAEEQGGGVDTALAGWVSGGWNGEEAMETATPFSLALNKTETVTDTETSAVEGPRPTAVELAGAVLDGDEKKAKDILSAGANINGPVRGATVLHLAAKMEGDKGRRMVIFLIDNGARVLEEDQKGDTPLKIAFLNDRAGSLAVLLDTVSPKSVRDFVIGRGGRGGGGEGDLLAGGSALLRQAMGSGSVGADTLRVLGDRVMKDFLFVEVSSGQRESLLLSAVRKGRGDLVPVLLELGFDAHEQGANEKGGGPESPFLLALQLERHDMVPLLTTNAETAQDGLKWAIHKGKHELISFFVERGARVDGVSGQKRPVFVAIEQGHLASLQQLISLGADVSVTEKIILIDYSNKNPRETGFSLLISALTYARDKGTDESRTIARGMIESLLAAGLRWTETDEDRVRRVGPDRFDQQLLDKARGRIVRGDGNARLKELLHMVQQGGDQKRDSVPPRHSQNNGSVPADPPEVGDVTRGSRVYGNVTILQRAVASGDTSRSPSLRPAPPPTKFPEQSPSGRGPGMPLPTGGGKSGEGANLHRRSVTGDSESPGKEYEEHFVAKEDDFDQSLFEHVAGEILNLPDSSAIFREMELCMTEEVLAAWGLARHSFISKDEALVIIDHHAKEHGFHGFWHPQVLSAIEAAYAKGVRLKNPPTYVSAEEYENHLLRSASQQANGGGNSSTRSRVRQTRSFGASSSLPGEETRRSKPELSANAPPYNPYGWGLPESAGKGGRGGGKDGAGEAAGGEGGGKDGQGSFLYCEWTQDNPETPVKSKKALRKERQKERQKKKAAAEAAGASPGGASEAAQGNGGGFGGGGGGFGSGGGGGGEGWGTRPPPAFGNPSSGGGGIPPPPPPGFGSPSANAAGNGQGDVAASGKGGEGGWGSYVASEGGGGSWGDEATGETFVRGGGTWGEAEKGAGDAPAFWESGGGDSW
uniref:Uncharacterized protein n=1 Tax=Chromera velia CCMP2878 TaxID=1169474 RepID=A0A0G4H9E3_9ALVE|eukprot:Cvel_5971.t1-p1 / transcript=Cvel_5971.t1 / gene=Cvel_5971 / organism=Chromera_velia_CCMP2878 / gene_product=hypothetical protein / transcript_product=hypothetical protein / location=Cvel_scaffold286:11562-15924(+) / protein_length=950 / sequence_SO=supercontig / SO=protein_coding / is_pseudo=false